jgi:ribosome maturation factor RimP
MSSDRDTTMPVSSQRVPYQAAVARTVTALHYDLVDVERSPGGLLRVTIDRVPGHAYTTGASDVIMIDDCELVTRQLQYALEVDGVDYARLEVSSPGLDRPLRKPEDFARFVGEAAEVVLKVPCQGRKRFRGVLAARDDGLRLLLDDSVGQKPDPRVRSKTPRKKAGSAGEATVASLDFQWEEVRDARLVPVVNFKGRASDASGATLPDARQAEVDGGLET